MTTAGVLVRSTVVVLVPVVAAVVAVQPGFIF